MFIGVIMPEVSRFLGIVIQMFFDEHNPPHFHAKYLHDKVILVKFNNGESHEIDFSDKLAHETRKVFEPLNDTRIFANFSVDYTLSWLDGQIDIAPEYIYFLAHKNDAKYQALFKKWGYIKKMGIH